MGRRRVDATACFVGARGPYRWRDRRSRVSGGSELARNCSDVSTAVGAEDELLRDGTGTEGAEAAFDPAGRGLAGAGVGGVASCVAGRSGEGDSIHAWWNGRVLARLDAVHGEVS